MNSRWLPLTASAIILTLTSGCSNPHFFPLTRPLFVGFDETKVPVSARTALAEAKTDFMLARKGEPPQFALFVREVPCSWSKEYHGRGYVLTLVNKGVMGAAGPDIRLESAITGDRPFQYDEIRDSTFE